MCTKKQIYFCDVEQGQGQGMRFSFNVPNIQVQ